MEMVGLVTMVTEVLTILSASANNIPVAVAISSFGTGLTAEKNGKKGQSYNSSRILCDTMYPTKYGGL